MTMDPSASTCQGEEKSESDAIEQKGASNDEKNDDQTNTKDSTNEPVRKKRKQLSDEKIEERKAANRRSAMESRERRKALIAELQREVDRLSNENKEFRAVNEAMRFQLQTVMIENQQLRMINSQAFQPGVQQQQPQQPGVQQQQPAGVPANVVTTTSNDTQPIANGIPQLGTGVLGSINGSALMSMQASQSTTTTNGTASALPQTTTSGTVLPQTATVNVNPSVLGTTALPSGVATNGQPILGTIPMLSLGSMLPFGIVPGMPTLPAVTTAAVPQGLAPGGGTNMPLSNPTETQGQLQSEQQQG